MRKVAINKEKIIVAAVMMAFAFILSFQCSNNLFHVGDVGTDSSVFKYVGRIIIDGGMPYKDTFDHKGPLIYLINAIGVLLGIQRGIWVVELCVIYISLLFFYRIARQQCNALLSCLITFFSSALLLNYFEGGNLVEEYAIPFIALSISIFFDYFDSHRISGLKILVCGAAFGAVIMLRVNMISLWVIMCLGVVYNCLTKRNAKELLKNSMFFVAGTCIVVLPILAWLAKGDALGDFVDCYWTFNRLYSGNNSLADRGATLFSFLNNSTLLFIVVTYTFIALKRRRLFDILYALYVVLELMMISLSGNYYMHYGMVLVPAIVYPTASIVNTIVRSNDINAFLKVIIAAYVLSYSVLPAWCNATVDFANDFATMNTSYISEHYYKLKSDIDIHSGSEDRIIVCDNDDFIYNFSNRFAATKYSYMTNPLLLNEYYKKECYKEIEKNPPKIVVLPNDYFDYEEISRFIIGNNYTLIDRIEKNSGDEKQSNDIIEVYVINK